MLSVRTQAAVLWIAALLPAFAQYSARRDGDTILLEDAKNQTVVTVVPTHGNSAVDMRFHGRKVLFTSPRGMSGIPFLAPWANRLDESAFYANGKRYPFNTDLGIVRAGPHPIHGFLTNTSDWEVVEAKSDAGAAWVTSRLDFYRHPDWLAEFPFAHTIEITYLLRDGTLEVRTKLNNLSTAPMPVAIGFHPYFQVDDAPRDQWTFGLAARTEWLLDKDKLPTGETRPIEQFLPDPRHSTLQGLQLDHVFSDLIRDSAGRATMYVQGKTQRVEVAFGPNYHAVVVYSPGGPNQDFICFEPMTGITNALNLAHRGIYKELQSIPPGQSWQESFWVTPK